MSQERAAQHQVGVDSSGGSGATRPWWLLLVLALLLAGCPETVIILAEPDADQEQPDAEDPQPDAQDQPEDVGPDDVDGPVASRCRIPPAPDLSPLSVARAFPSLAFQQPVYVTSARDGSNRLFVVEKRGVIHVFPNDPNVAQAQVFLDLRDRVFSRGGNDERGLLGLAFDPDFENNGYLWVNYTGQGPGTPTTVSRFKVNPGTPDSADPASEVIALQFAQPYGNHNGGMIDFGPDGYLYIAVGDGGSAGDPENNAQNTSNIFGTILRIDVEGMGNDGTYRIPPDNPLIGTGGSPEIYAWGLRNVWRFGFDRLTGQLWAADVGQKTIEEIDIIEKGANYGWRPMEGKLCYNPVEGCESPEYTGPVAQYDHTVGLSITGGFVYRGQALPELTGAYIYGDFANGQIFALTPSDEADPELPEGHDAIDGMAINTLATTSLKISSFGEDEAGELLIVGYVSGGLYRLERAGPVDPGEPLPLTLTETGCFQDVATQTLDPGLVPYTVNAPLWSDFSHKERFFVLPQGQKLAMTENSAWEFPVGTIIIKNFYLERVLGDPNSRQIIETRFLKRDEDTWHGYSYQWNDAQTEAFLLSGAATRTFEINDRGQLRSQIWSYPSRGQCRACHTDASGQVLGLSTGQLNGPFDYGDGQPVNQIEHLVALGLVSNPPQAPVDQLTRYPDPFGAAPLADRARAYMQSNCAPCHLPNGTATSDIDLRFETPLAATRACDAEPKEGDLGQPGLKILDPGSAANSSIYLRMVRRDDKGMPPLASAIIHNDGANLVRDWINSLGGCQ